MAAPAVPPGRLGHNRATPDGGKASRVEVQTQVCAALDCEMVFAPTVPQRRYCSHRCRERARQHRNRGTEPKRRYSSYLAGLRLPDDSLATLRDAAVDELVAGALADAERDHLRRVADLVMRADRAIGRFGAEAR